MVLPVGFYSWRGILETEVTPFYADDWVDCVIIIKLLPNGLKS